VDNGKNQLAALGAATPLLANAMALSMPCREMCEAVMSSCSCGKERTFGELLQSVIDDQNLVRCPGVSSNTVETPLLSLNHDAACLDHVAVARRVVWIKPTAFMKLDRMVPAGSGDARPASAVQKSQQRIPPNLSKLIFGDLLEQPLCSLFASSSTPGFSGHCDALPTQCSNEKHWCQDGNPGPALVQQLIAGQIAKVSLLISAGCTILHASTD